MAIKVSQATIDKIKKMGMTKALASAKTNRSPEFQEGLRRMYGQRRLDAAMKGAQGGSASRETYMKRGYSARPTSSGKSAPVKKGGGQGYKNQPVKAKPKSRAGAIAAATGAAGAAGVYAKGKSVQKKLANMTAAEKKVYKAKMEKRAASLSKFAQSKTGKAIGKIGRAATGKTAIGAAAIYGGSKYISALKSEAAKTKARRKAGQTDKSAGGARATAMKKSRGR